MNRKQLITLLVLGAVLGGAALFLNRQSSSSWKAASAGPGGTLIPDLKVNDVALIQIRQAGGTVHVLRTNDAWVVQERFGFPANVGEISEFLLKAKDLKAIQTEKVGPSQLGRLELNDPGKGTNGAGTLVEFKDAAGKGLGSLLLGKKHVRKGAAGSPFGGDEGYPDGRYILVPGGSGDVAVVNEPFSNIEAKPESWTQKEFFKVEKVKSVEVTHASGAGSWLLKRETETGEMKLADLKETETLDTAKAGGVQSVLSYPSFTDVVAPDVAPATVGLDKPVTARIETFDGFTYTVRVGGGSGGGTEESHHLKYEVAANLAKERPAGKDEKPEDKERLDKEFKEKLGKLSEKLQQEQALSKWTYKVSKWTVENLLKERKDFLAEKKEEKPVEGGGGVPAAPGFLPTPPLPK